MSLSVEPTVTGETAKQAVALPAVADPPPRSFRRLGVRHVIAALLGLWLLSGIYLVAPDQQAVVTRFGKVVEPRVMPGIHYTWPYPIGGVFKLKVRQLQRAVIGGEAADGVLGRMETLRSQFLTGDQNLIQVRAIVQYSVATPADYLFRVREVADAVASAVGAEMGRQIASRTVDEVLTTGKVAIQEAVRQRAQALLDGYGLGVVLSTINIDQVAAPPEAADAFRDVASARADAARFVNEAEGYANDSLPRARGEAQRLLQAAEGYKQRKTNEALGDASRFRQLAREYARAPEVTRSRLYLETMEEVLPRLKKTIVDTRGDLDLTIIRRGQPSRPDPVAPAGNLPNER